MLPPDCHACVRVAKLAKPRLAVRSVTGPTERILQAWVGMVQAVRMALLGQAVAAEAVVQVALLHHLLSQFR
jgi:hypothetical protein